MAKGHRVWRPALILTAVLGAIPAVASELESVEPEAERERAPPEDGIATSDDGSTEADVLDLPIYVPPSRGAARIRVGAATRGIPRALPTLVLAAPDHVGLTYRQSPVIHWHLSAPSDVRVDVTLTERGTAHPLLALSVEPPVAAGYHALDLSDHGVTLAEGVIYDVDVALVPAPQVRARDVIVRGAIERVASEPLTRGDSIRELAARGIWFDAFDEAQRSVARSGSDPGAMEARDSLLEQIERKPMPADDVR